MTKNLLVKTLTDILKSYTEKSGIIFAAAIAYFSLFAIGPLLLLTIIICSLIYDLDEIKYQLLSYLEEYITPKALPFLEELLDSLLVQQEFSLSFIASLVVIVISGGTLFNAIHYILSDIFEVNNNSNRGAVRTYINRRGKSFLGSFVIGFSMLIILMLTSLSGIVSNLLPHSVKELIHFGFFLQSILPMAVFFLALSILFRILTDYRPFWKASMMGSFITCILLLIVKFGVNLILRSESTETIYSISGSIIIFMIWIFLGAQAFLLGAHVVRSTDHQLRRKKPVPSKN